LSLYFIETGVFTRRLQQLELESELRNLQNELAANPLVGDLERGTGGLRKVRMADPSRNKGKRGGARVHYLYVPERKVIYLIFVYGKNDQVSLSSEEKKKLKAVAEKIRTGSP